MGGSVLVLPPVACYGCGKRFTENLYNQVMQVQARIEAGEPLSFHHEMNRIGLIRECCRNYIMSESVMPTFDILGGKELIDTDLSSSKYPSIDGYINLLNISGSRNEKLEGSSEIRAKNVIALSSRAKDELELQSRTKIAEIAVKAKIGNPEKIEALLEERRIFEKKEELTEKIHQIDLKLRGPNYRQEEQEVAEVSRHYSHESHETRMKRIAEIRAKYSREALSPSDPEYTKLMAERMDTQKHISDVYLRDFWILLEIALHGISEKKLAEMNGNDLFILYFERRFRNIVEKKLSNPELFGHTRRYIRKNMGNMKQPWRKVNLQLKPPYPRSISSLEKVLESIPKA